jgi:hypothetical protein
MATGSVPWHYTTIVDFFDHWQTLFAGLIALLAAVIAVILTLTAESRKAYRERQEKELTQLNGAATAMGYNIEALLHIVEQQILPHYEQSHAALVAMHTTENNTAQLRVFVETIDSQFTAMMTRCPEPYFIYLEFFKDIPFVVAKDSELLKRSGWMMFYAQALKELISEQNRRIEIAERVSLDFKNLEEQIRVQANLDEQIRIQANIAQSEIINSLMLFEQFIAICEKLEKLTKSYKKKFGERLAVRFPAPLDDTMDKLRIAAQSSSQPRSQ